MTVFFGMCYVYKLICIYKGKVKSAILALFNGPEVLPSAADKPELFSEIDNSNLDDFGIFLCFYPFRTNQKLHNISVTPKLVKKAITIIVPSKACGPDFILVVVLKNCEPDFSYILSELCNKSLKESCFPDCWKVSSWTL